MLEYTLMVAQRPSDIRESHIHRLRDAGFDDTAIGDIAANAALFAFFTRIVDALGASLDPGMEEEAKRVGIWHWHAERTEVAAD